MKQTGFLKPMPLWMSVLFFGIPSAIATIGIYVGIPALDRAGLPIFTNFYLMTVGPMSIMFAAALIAYRLEGNPLTWNRLKERFRLKPIRGKEWYWTIGLVVVYIGGYFLLLPTAKWLAAFPLFEPPNFIPSLVDPRAVETGIPTEMLGVQLKGAWWVAGVHAVTLFFNIFGEEFWWRGYILPRQELVHGRWTWLVHAILWNLFHVFWRWNLIALIASTWSLSYVVSKTKNNTHGIIVHLLNNVLGLVVILLGVLGLGG
jgi:membrane protease YdiL (CAAX protease family)